MREGLRSGRRPLRDDGSSGEMLVQKELFDVVLDREKSRAVSNVVMGLVSTAEEVGFDDLGTFNGREKVKKKRKSGECGSEIDCLRPEKKGREGVLKGEMQIVGRVLRSSGKGSNSEVVPKLKRVASGRAPKRCGRLVVSPGTLGVLRNQPLQKRVESDLRNNYSETEGSVELRRVTRSSTREGKSGKPSLDYADNFSDVEMQETVLVKSLEAENTVSLDEDVIPQAEGSDEGGAIEAGTSCNDKGDGELSRASEKRLVRDRIVNLLLDAGWTVDYRPRNGRLYNDAVYVSPDGKTHWSCTLAYRVLKQHYEAGDTEAYKEGFIFSPLSEGDFCMLKRVQVKKRNCKNEQKVLKTAGRQNRFVARKNKHLKKSEGELLSGSGACTKSTNGRRKGGYSKGAHGASSCSGIEKRRETHNRKTYALLVRGSDGADSSADGYVLYNGKRTTLAWMIDAGVVAEKAKVSYMNPRKTRAILQGKITRDGIDCGCCGEVVTISEFESHAGSYLSRPHENILVENGSSIQQYLLDAWNKLESERNWFHLIDVDGDDPNDDTCGLCGDGGNLVCCDGCPSTFHQNCLDIQNFPSGDWFCPNCTCKYCGKTGEDTAERSVEGMESSLLTCCLCEEKYHNSCTHSDDAPVKDKSTFCGRKCHEICDKIVNFLGVKHELEDGFSWTLVRRCEIEADISSIEKARKVECNSKLAVALSVMDECFLPCPDHRTGANLIHNIIYSCRSNFNRLNYSGFYTVTLEMGDEIVAVATIRIHGNTLAEMPYIGTRYMYRHRGMCRRLLAAVEWILHSLNVANLVIPAISEMKETWTSVFGFEPLDASTHRRMRSMNVLVFPGVNMLKKPILNHQFTGGSIVGAAGLIASEGEDLYTVNEAVKVSDCSNIFSGKLGANVASAVTAVNVAEGKVSAAKPLLNVSSNDLSDITSESMECTNFRDDNISLPQIGEHDKCIDPGILDTDCDSQNQAKEEIGVHHQSAKSNSLAMVLESEKAHLQSVDTNCCVPILAVPPQDFTCEAKVESSPDPSISADKTDWKQAKEDIDVRHQSAEPDSLTLFSESEKVHPHRDFAHDTKVRSSPEGSSFDPDRTVRNQAMEDTGVHHQSADSDSLTLILESEKAQAQSQTTNCCLPDSAVLHQDFACEVKIESSPNGPCVDTDSPVWKQAEGDIDARQQITESDSLTLISEAEKAIPQSGGKNCCLPDSHKDLACEVRVGSSTCGPYVGTERTVRMQATEDIDAQHESAESNSIALISEKEKAHEQPGVSHCCVHGSSVLHRDFACELTAGSNSYGADMKVRKQAKEDINGHHHTTGSDSLVSISEKEKAHPQSGGTNCCILDLAAVHQEFSGKAKGGGSPREPIATDRTTGKQAKENTDVHPIDSSDSFYLISETEKSHPASELDRKFEFDAAKVGSNSLEPCVASRDDSKEHSVGGCQIV